jgi:cyclopropane-fatty-acyl-phospholipid synthase
MKTVSLASENHLATGSKPSFLEGLARRLVIRQLESLESGCLMLSDGAFTTVFGQAQAEAELVATIEVADSSFYADIAFGGSIGAGEAYMRGAWQCEDLVSLVRILLRNRSVLDDMEKGSAWLITSVQRALHWINRNTREGARRNIAAHYDLGNEFFALWLDESMMYSSAMFKTPEQSLADAQLNRLDVVCKKLGLGPGDHVIEIGTGWGGFAIHAAKNYGCRVTTTTISKKQYEMAWQRIQQAGLQDRIELLLEDYRDLEGQYDKLVSIEMIEAVGWRFYPDFLRAMSRLLEPHGKAAVQAIAIQDQVYERAKRSVDFIQRHIFPGSCIPSTTALLESMRDHSDLRLAHLEDMTPHYARTLRDWRENLAHHRAEVQRLGYDESFLRLWDFYLCYCEGGFAERVIHSVQYLFSKPLDRSAPFLPGL